MQPRFLKVFEGQSQFPPPFWFMRQAGRYMAEYRALRETAGSFLNLCMNPVYAAEVTLQPIRKFDMDAAILFADILLVPMALGIDLKFENGEGPKLGSFDIEKLQYDQTKLQPVFETLKLLRQALELRNKALIGFAGSPWTVATYMVEGGSSKDFAKVKSFAKNQPAKFQKIIDVIVEATIKYLTSQIDAGAQALQLFDSWASVLDEKEFERWVIKPTGQIIAALKKHNPEVKLIGFPRQVEKELLKKFVSQTGVNGVSIDHTINLEWAFANLNTVIQGNLDPALLLKSQEEIGREAKRIIAAAKGKAFIFNLGHGINQHTPVENVAYLSELIKNS